MQKLFLELVKLSLIGSLFALAVMAVRLIFRRAPKWIFCVLWGIVALRLIVPISVESDFSLVPDRLASGQIITNVGSDYIGEVDIIYESNAGYSNALEAGRQPICSNDGYYVVTEKDSLEAPKTVGETVYPVLSWIWLAGMVLMLTYTAVSYTVLKRKMAEATLLRDNIWQCEQVESPFVLGFIRPRIYLPYQISQSDMANVIAHEQAHIRRKDHWWKPIGFLLLSVHWFNPVVWVAYVLLCRDIEAACDEKVIKHMEKDEIRAYSTALLHCSVHRRWIAACPLAFGEVGVKERIKWVMNYKKPAFWIIIVAVVLCVVIAVCFITSPSTSPEFAMNGNNVHDLDVDTIIGRIQKVEGLGDGNAYINSNNFHLIIDSDFNWVDSQTVRYFFYEGKETHSAQLRIFPDENKYFITESSEWGEQDHIFLLRHYLDAIKYLPQEAIRQMAPADRYIVRQIEEGSPNNYSRVITYTPNGTKEIEDWLIHLQVEPLHAAEEGYVGTGDEVIQLFYSNANDQIGDINKLLSLVCVVEEVTYESGSYSFSMVAQENTPIYAIAEDMQLSSQKEVSEEGTWAQLGKLEETELTKENFDELFKDPGNWADNTNAKSIRNNTENAWQLIYNQDVLYYVLQQKNGDLYLAYGYTGFSNNDAYYAHIRWLYKLAIDTTGLSGMIAKSGNGAVSMVSFPKGTMIKDYVDSVYWLTINPSDEEFVPFTTWRDGEEIRGFYTAYDAVTFEPLKHIIPSGLDPQTYLFQNADPSRAYIVLAAFSMDADAEIYAFGARFTAEDEANGTNAEYNEVTLTETVSDTQESSYRVRANLPGTDLSSPGQMLTDKIEKEWNTFDSMTHLQQVTSSHLWGTIYIETDTWNECEEAIGVAVYNPLESFDWINKTGYFGMESADPSIPVTHVEAAAYATHVTDRELSRIDITSGYSKDDVRITLTASICGETAIFTTGMVSHGYAVFEHKRTSTGAGTPVLVVTPNESNNTGYYNDDYFDQVAYWVEDNAFYTLRVFGNAEDRKEIQNTLAQILAGI